MAIIDNLVAYWQLNEAANANAIDSVGTNTLTDENGNVGTRTGVVAGARTFNGLSTYLDHATNATLDMGAIDFTISTWVYITTKSAGTEPPIVSKWSGAQQYRLEFHATDDLFEMLVHGSSYGIAKATTFGSPSTGQWIYIAAGYDSVNHLVFISVNAGAQDTVSYSDGMGTGTSPLALGGYFGDDVLNGAIDETGLWKRVLSPTEITWLYNSGSGRSYADIVAGMGGGTLPPGQSTGMWD